MLNLTIVISVFNEEEVLSEFWKTLKIHLSKLKDFKLKVIFVNDGSTDNSQIIINRICEEDSDLIKFISIKFSKNYGHEAAMIAGIDNTEDDMIICMDADLQHPPEKINDMLLKYKEGFEIVLMNREKRKGNKAFKNMLSNLFYYFIGKLSVHKFEPNASDFFLISKNVALVLKSNFRERNRFIRGFIQVIGFNLTTVNYVAPSRSAGKSNYSLKNLFKLGFTAIFAFSNKPLKLSLFFSIIFLIFSIVVIIYSLIVYFFGEAPPSGYTSIIIFQSVGFTVISFLISVLSIYFGRSLEEIRDRPIYIIESKKETQ